MEMVMDILKCCVPLPPDKFDELPQRSKMHILLGKRFGDPTAENRIDKHVKEYLKKCWSTRAEVSEAIDQAFNVHYCKLGW